MRSVVIAALALSLTALVASCETDLDALLAGRKCRDVGSPCLIGYICRDEICVPGSSGAGGSELGQGGNGAAGEGGIGGTDPRGPGGIGGTTNLGGAAGSGAGGAEKSDAGGSGAEGGSEQPAPDAGEPDLDAGCTPVPLYIDIDGDGYGREPPVQVACPKEPFVTLGGDCMDAPLNGYNNSTSVHPGQTDYFVAGYKASGDLVEVSFDYDCSGEEEGDLTNSPSGAAPCPEDLLGGLSCEGTGYEEYRFGEGINPICGSEFLASCEVQLTLCVAVRAELPTDQLYRCR